MLYVCEDCSTVYAPAQRCPHCGSSEYYIQGEDDVPKNTVHGGASHELDLDAEQSEDVIENEAPADVEQPEIEPDPEPEPAQTEPDPEPEPEPDPEPAVETPADETPAEQTGRRPRR